MAKRALYIGPSHAAGGIPVTIDGTRQVEVEGMEYKICGDAYRSPERLDFTGKTNIEVLDYIHTEFACKFEQNKASGNDFIICKLAVRDVDKHDRSGTVREILDQMQGEVGCKLSDGSMPEAKQSKGGMLTGNIYEKQPLFGQVQAWSEYEKLCEHRVIAILYGQVKIKMATTFDLVDENADIEEVVMGKADLYDLTDMKLAAGPEVMNVVAKAITLPGNTVAELQALAVVKGLDYDTISSISTIEEAAKIMGYDGICVYHDKSYPTLISVWNLAPVIPLVINQPHNHKLFEPKLEVFKMATGGNVSGYDARVKNNLAQMHTEAVDWRAVPVIGTNVVEVNGKEKTMPIFDFPVGYAGAPTIYKNNSGPGNIPCCELCGKEPIGTFYWIQNDNKKWTLGVGSECIRHFQIDSGKEMLRAAKVAEAKEFLLMLRKVCRWIKKVGYKSDNDQGPLTPPKPLQRNMNKWRSIWQDEANPFVKNHSNRVYLWNFYDQLFPFDYDDELHYLLTTPTQRFDVEQKKWVSNGPSDPETCRLDAEKKLLSWYTRNKDKKLDVIKKFSDLLTSQEKLIPESKEQSWVKNAIDESNNWNAELLGII